jgi:hypothetical protein
MLATIGFHNQFSAQADKVDDVTTDRSLPAKLNSA